MDVTENAFLMNCWYVAAWDHELLDGKILARTLLNKPVVLFRGESGKYVALDDRCCHRAAPLSMGRLEGDCIRCMYHGLKFDDSGTCVEIPGQDRIPPTFTVYSYPIEERNHLIWIWMGDPALADPDLIEDFHWRDDPGWQSKGELLPLKANYRLLVENLCDLTHVPFIHPTSLNETMIDRNEQAPVKTTRDGSSVTVERWEFDQPAPSYFRAMAGMKRDDRVDRGAVVGVAQGGEGLLGVVNRRVDSTDHERVRVAAQELEARLEALGVRL